MLIQSIHVCSVRYSHVAASVVHGLMEFLGESNNPAAVDVIAFVRYVGLSFTIASEMKLTFLLREVVEKFPDLRKTITDKVTLTFVDIKSGKVYRGTLWIVGEYCDAPAGMLYFTFHLVQQAITPIIIEILSIFQELRKVLGEIPILASEQRLLDESGVEESEGQRRQAQGCLQ